MLVALSPNLNRSTEIKTTNAKPPKQSICINQKCSHDNVSFGSDPTLIILVARGGIEVLKNGPRNINLIKFMNEVEKIIKSPVTYKEQLPDMLSALSKTPDDASATNSYVIFGLFMDRDTNMGMDVGLMRSMALEILNKVDDSSYVNIQSKKDFIMSWFNNGRPILNTFIDQFKKMSDVHYKTFKQEVIDKSLFSKAYSQKITPTWTSDFMDRTNLELIETLDLKTYSEYLQKTYPTIIKLKKQIFNNLIENNNLYKSFKTNFKSPCYARSKSNTDEYAKTLWNETAKACNYDKAKIAKALKMSECDVAEMLAARV